MRQTVGHGEAISKPTPQGPEAPAQTDGHGPLLLPARGTLRAETGGGSAAEHAVLMANKCSAPKSQSVKAHTRARPLHRKKIAQKVRAGLPYVVRDSRTGRVVSRHRKYNAAAIEAKRRDRLSFRAGRGRPYEAGKA